MADSNVHQLTEATAVPSTAELYLALSPFGSTDDRRITIANLLGTSLTTTLNLFNTGVTTVNAFGAATTIAIGAATGTLTLNNPSVRFANGSAAAPSITFANDLDTGLWIGPASGVGIAFTVDGASRFRISDNGIVLAATESFRWSSDANVFEGSGSDVFLFRDAGNVLALRNGVNAQALRIYGNATDIGFIDWSSNYFRVGATYTGAGSYRAVRFATSGNDNWEIATTGNFLAVTDNTYDIGAAGANRPRTVYIGTSLVSPTLYGDTAANGDITIEGTSHATKTSSYVILQPTGGNVGIGTTGPNANALLDITSTSKAFMPPRMTTAQRDLIASPAEGMLVYNITTHVLDHYNGTAWGAV